MKLSYENKTQLQKTKSQKSRFENKNSTVQNFKQTLTNKHTVCKLKTATSSSTLATTRCLHK